jgi:L-iditol 2-dehydrogenase
MKYLLCTTTDSVDLHETDTPRIGPGEVLVKLNACGICGTDALKIYNTGYSKPQKLGHECVGTIVEIGAGTTRFAVGQRIGFAHHVPDYGSHLTRFGSGPMDELFKQTNIDPGGFSEFIRLSALHVQHTAVAVPDSVPDMRAIFMEPLACCLRALDRVPLREGQSALVVGVGAIGMLFVPLLRDRSVTTLVSDLRTERLALAKKWGARDGVLATDDVSAVCKRHTDNRGVDCVILTALNQATFDAALATVRDGGTIILFGGKPATELKFDAWKLFIREINLVTSYSTTPELLPRAMALLSRDGYPLEQLVSHVLHLDEAAVGFELVHKAQASKVAIVP